MTRPPFLVGVPLQAIAWGSLASTSHPGASGTATMREVAAGPLRLRHIEYSAGYRSDHYCDLGHAALVVAGEIELWIHERPPARLTAGMSFVVGSQAEPHLVASPTGATLFVVD
jgi:quercetin dioxygenase-like cupin family protein